MIEKFSLFMQNRILHKLTVCKMTHRIIAQYISFPIHVFNNTCCIRVGPIMMYVLSLKIVCRSCYICVNVFQMKVANRIHFVQYKYLFKIFFRVRARRTDVTRIFGHRRKVIERKRHKNQTSVVKLV